MSGLRLEYITAGTAGIDTGRGAAFRFRWALPGEKGAGADDSALIESVGRSGVLHPPLLAPAERGVRLVSGFRRVAAARRAGFGEVPALRIAGAAPDEADLLPLWLEEAAAGKPPSEMERIVLALRAADMAGEGLPSLLPLLSRAFGRDISAGFISRLSGLVSLPRGILGQVHRGRISPGDLLMLGGHPAVELEKAARLLAGAGLSRGARRRAVGMMLRIADRGEDAFNSFIEKHRSSGGDLVESLEAAALPRMSGDIADAEELIGGMGLPSHTSVHLPEGMEGGKLTVEMRIRGEEDLRAALEKLGEGLEAGAVGKLIGILRGFRGK
jgi:ParB-like chromosome segregation protein Spo0J